MMKELVYSTDKVVEHLYVGNSYRDLVISGRIYKEIKKLWFRKPEVRYTYSVSVPFIEDPFYDGEYNTNRVLQVYSSQMKQHLFDKIQEFEENERNDSSRTSKEKESFGGNTKFVY